MHNNNNNKNKLIITSTYIILINFLFNYYSKSFLLNNIFDFIIDGQIRVQIYNFNYIL